MDGVIEESFVRQLLEAVGDGDVGVIVGVSLLIVVGLVRMITRDRLDKPAADWVSSSAALVAGVGLLLAGGRSWLEAALVGLLVVPSSRGFWELLGSILPKKKDDEIPPPVVPRSMGGPIILALILAVSLSAGCATPRAQIGVRTALTSAAEGVNSADRILAVDAQEASDQALTTIRATCATPCPDAVEQYRSAMASYREAVQALEATHEALEAADEVVEVWIATGDLPNSWMVACNAAAEATSRLLSAVASATATDPPEALSVAPVAILGACRLAEPFIVDAMGGE